MEGTERQDRTIQLISLAHQGDKEARDALVEENVGLIWSIVRRFAGRGCETEDLFQIGSIGLMKAIDKFDTAFDVKFSTYAVPMIMGEIKRFLRDDGIIKVSRSIREMGIRVSASRQKLSGTLGREPTLEELAEDVGPAAKRWPFLWRPGPRWNLCMPRRQEERRQICLSWTELAAKTADRRRR